MTSVQVFYSYVIPNAPFFYHLKTSENLFVIFGFPKCLLAPGGAYLLLDYIPDMIFKNVLIEIRGECFEKVRKISGGMTSISFLGNEELLSFPS